MNDKLITDLKAWGCDTDGALRRLCGDKELYDELLREYFADEPVKALLDTLRSGDVKAAFRAAHSMKGVLGNLGVTPLYAPVFELTEILRRDSFDGAEKYTGPIADSAAQLEDILAKDEA